MTNQRHDVDGKKKLFAELEQKPGIKVEFQVFADEYKDQFKLDFESGKAPDIYNMNVPGRKWKPAGRSRSTTTWPGHRG